MGTTSDQDQSERAYRQICDDLAAGRYRPGQRLVEADVAQRAGVSRTPVRQALQRLERNGVVRIEKRRGATICELSAQQIADLYEVRAQLEAFACQLAARRAEDSNRDELRQAAESFNHAAKHDRSNDLADVRAANAALHRKIAKVARNPFLQVAIETTIENPLVFLAFQRFSREELGRSALFHDLIIQSICAGDGDRAGRLMAEHVLQAKDTLVAAFDAQS